MNQQAQYIHNDGTPCPGDECEQCPNSACGCHEVDCGQYVKWAACERHRVLGPANGFIHTIQLADISLEVLEYTASRTNGGALSLIDYVSGDQCGYSAEEVRGEIEHRKSQPRKRETDKEKWARLSRIPLALTSAEEKHFLKYGRLPAELRPRFNGAK
jgi:hypothetical protein